MQTKVTITLALGFIMGLTLASCASTESHRSVASDSAPRYSNSSDGHQEKIECQLGEERNEFGDCERPHEFERPYRRGGR